MHFSLKLADVHLIVQWTNLFIQWVWHFNKTSQFEYCFKNEKHIEMLNNVERSSLCRNIYFLCEVELRFCTGLSCVKGVTVDIKKFPLTLFWAIYKKYLLYIFRCKTFFKMCHNLVCLQNIVWHINNMTFGRQSERGLELEIETNKTKEGLQAITFDGCMKTKSY